MARRKDPEEGVDYQYLTVWTVTAYFRNPGRYSHTWGLNSKTESIIRNVYDEIVRKMHAPDIHGPIFSHKNTRGEDTFDVRRIDHIKIESEQEMFNMQGKRLYSIPYI